MREGRRANLSGTSGRLSGASSHSSNLSLRSTGWVDEGTGGQERGCCGGAACPASDSWWQGQASETQAGLVDADRGRPGRMMDAPVPATTDWRRAEELFDAPKVL